MNSEELNELIFGLEPIREQNQMTAPTAPADSVECRQGLNEPSTDKPLHDADWDEDYKCAVVYGEEESEPVYLLERGGVGCFPLGDIVMIKGQRKNGKSIFISIVVAAILKGECIGFKRRKAVGKVHYYDLEQRRPNAAKQNIRVYELVGDLLKNDNKDWKHFAVFSLRGKNRQARKAFIERRILAEHPEVVVIDGIRDLINDKNSQTEAPDIVDWIEHLSQREDGGCTTFICVLHENPNADNDKMTGAIGTEMGNKMSEAYKVKHTGKKGVFEVSVADDDCRNLPIEKFTYMLDMNAIPVSADSVIEQDRMRKDAELLDTIRKVFLDEGVTELRAGELDELVAKRMGYGKGENTTIRKALKDLRDRSLLPHTNRGNSIICTYSGKVANSGNFNGLPQ